MVQPATDFFKVGIHKTKKEFEEWENDLYNKTNLQFPNRKSGRITGEELPDSIDKKAGWAKHNLHPNMELKHVKIKVTETDYLRNGKTDFYIEISCKPAVSINKGKNNKPIGLKATEKLIRSIENDYSVKASELELHGYEKTMNLVVHEQTVSDFNRSQNRFLVFQSEKLHPFYNEETNQFMGYKCALSHFDYKFYLVDAKYGEQLNCFRIERHYKRTQNLKRDIGIKTLEDILSLEKTLKSHKQSLSDFDDTIIYDPTINPTRKLTKKETNLLANPENADFWLEAKCKKDKKTFTDWVKTYRKLSHEFGDGLHSKIRNKIQEQVLEIEEAIEKEKLKNSLDVTSWITCNKKGLNNKKDLVLSIESDIVNYTKYDIGDMKKKKLIKSEEKKLIKSLTTIRTIMRKASVIKVGNTTQKYILLNQV